MDLSSRLVMTNASWDVHSQPNATSPRGYAQHSLEEELCTRDFFVRKSLNDPAVVTASSPLRIKDT